MLAEISSATMRAVLTGLNEGVRLLSSDSGQPAPRARPSPDADASYRQEIAGLSAEARARIRAAERKAALADVLQSPFFANVTERAVEIDATFAMLADDLSRDTLDLVIRFRLLSAAYPQDFLHQALGGPMPAERWEEARQSVLARTDLPKGMTPFAYAFYWGLGLHSLPEHCAVEAGDVVLECGAFVGDSTLYLRSLCGPEGRIHAFELVPETYAKLVANLALNEVTNVTAINKGLWDSSGTLPAVFSAAGSRVDPVRTHGSSQDYAAVTTIDDYCTEAKLPRLDFIKIDAPSGAEKILIGAQRTLGHFRPRLAVNIHYNEGSDYATVPILLRESLRGPYKYYIRHYARTHRYTIIYASPDN
jgi:FkbM family methyltransferase